MSKTDRLAEFLAIAGSWMERSAGLPPGDHSIAMVIENWSAALSPSEWGKAVRIGARDIVASLRHASAAEISELESLLRDAGAPSIARVRAETAINWKTVVARGDLRNEEEYYAAMEILNDSAYPFPARDRLAQMADRFEEEVASEVT